MHEHTVQCRAAKGHVTSLMAAQRNAGQCAAQRAVQCSAAQRSAVQCRAVPCSAHVLGRSVCNQSTALGTALHAGTVETLLLAAGLGLGSTAPYEWVYIYRQYRTGETAMTDVVVSWSASRASSQRISPACPRNLCTQTKTDRPLSSLSTGLTVCGFTRTGAIWYCEVECGTSHAGHCHARQLRSSRTALISNALRTIAAHFQLKSHATWSSESVQR